MLAFAKYPGVGDTPTLEVEGILVKLECVNRTGSVKDRVAWAILSESKRRGLLRPGQPIVEATSGNTGIAMAYFGAKLGHPVTIVMPENMTDERKARIRDLGAELILCSVEGSFAEAAEIRDRMAQTTIGLILTNSPTRSTLCVTNTGLAPNCLPPISGSMPLWRAWVRGEL